MEQKENFLDCYFFGTFNPVHLGHIELARKIKEEFSFDKIIFVPAFLPPHKETLEFEHRYNMLKLCVDKGLGEVSDIESRLAPPSYTYQTIEKLYKEHKGGQKIPFIIGYDAFIGIEGWKNPEILKEKLDFIVLKRHTGVKREEIEKLRKKGFSFKIAENIDYFDVSSNEIREKTAKGENRGGLIDKKVERYIDEHGLYKG